MREDINNILFNESPPRPRLFVKLAKKTEVPGEYVSIITPIHSACYYSIARRATGIYNTPLFAYNPDRAPEIAGGEVLMLGISHRWMLAYHGMNVLSLSGGHNSLTPDAVYDFWLETARPTGKMQWSAEYITGRRALFGHRLELSSGEFHWLSPVSASTHLCADFTPLIIADTPNIGTAVATYFRTALYNKAGALRELGRASSNPIAMRVAQVRDHFEAGAFETVKWITRDFTQDIE